MTPVDDTPEDYQFLPRLFGSYLLAVVGYVAFGKSLYIEAVVFIAWLVVVAHLFRRFGRRGLWTLIGSPFALYWAWAAWRAAHNEVLSHPAGAIIV